MHDIKTIRDDPQAFDQALGKRGEEAIAQNIIAADELRRSIATELQGKQARRNEASKAIGKAKASGNEEEARALMAEVGQLKSDMPVLEDKAREADAAFTALMASIPNLPADNVPEGEDEDANIELARWGDQPSFDFKPQEHADFAPDIGMEFETAAAMSGARFTFLRGSMARLHRAVAQFMLDMQTGRNGYTECAPPLLVRDETMFGTGQLPKFGEDAFQTTDGRWLISTSEISLTNSVRESILNMDDLPLRLCALTPCFRSEAGSAGRDTRGFIRQHQFEKVEMVSICTPDHAVTEHDHMVASAQAVLEALQLPYRTMFLCAGDMGATVRKTYDLEVWLPGQGAYREISSISWCGDYQARRMQARYRPDANSKGTAYLHTLNGSGLAVGRTLVAILENYQQADGSVEVPEALHPYMGGVIRIERS